MNHKKCIRVNNYGPNDELPLCGNLNCTCVLLENEKYCPTCLDSMTTLKQLQEKEDIARQIKYEKGVEEFCSPQSNTMGWDKRCLEIATMADKGDDEGYGHALAKLAIDIPKALSQVRKETLAMVLKEIEEMEVYDTKNNWCAGFLKALDTLKTKLQAKDIEQ